MGKNSGILYTETEQKESFRGRDEDLAGSGKLQRLRFLLGRIQVLLRQLSESFGDVLDGLTILGLDITWTPFSLKACTRCQKE